MVPISEVTHATHFIYFRVWFATEVFAETALGLCDAIQSLSARFHVRVVDSSGVTYRREPPYNGDYSLYISIFIGASYLPFVPTSDIGQQLTVVYQMEQMHSPHFTAHYWEVMRAAAQLWDFSPLHTRCWNGNAALPPARFVPLPLPVDAIEAESGPQHGVEVIEEIDVLFYGASNDRRAYFQRCFEVMAPALNVRFIMSYNLFGEQRDEMIKKAKVVLNIHFYPHAALEVHRIDYLLAKSKCVISERSADPELDAAYQDAVAFVDVMEEPPQAVHLVHETLRILNDSSERMRLKLTGLNFIRNKQELSKQPLKEAIDELIEERLQLLQPRAATDSSHTDSDRGNRQGT